MNKLQQCLSLVLASCISTAVFAVDSIFLHNNTNDSIEVTATYNGVVQDYDLPAHATETIATIGKTSSEHVAPTELSVFFKGKSFNIFSSFLSALRTMKGMLGTPKKVALIIDANGNVTIKKGGEQTSSEAASADPVTTYNSLLNNSKIDTLTRTNAYLLFIKNGGFGENYQKKLKYFEDTQNFFSDNATIGKDIPYSIIKRMIQYDFSHKIDAASSIADTKKTIDFVYNESVEGYYDRHLKKDKKEEYHRLEIN